MSHQGQLIASNHRRSEAFSVRKNVAARDTDVAMPTLGKSTLRKWYGYIWCRDGVATSYCKLVPLVVIGFIQPSRLFQ